MIKVVINSNIHTVWDVWNKTEHINNWYSGHEDWYTSNSVNNLKVGNTFMYLMKSKIGTEYFELTGEYTQIINHKMICYCLEDKRKVETNFHEIANKVLITQKIEPDTTNSFESQARWWRSIILNFKHYAEK